MLTEETVFESVQRLRNNPYATAEQQNEVISVLAEYLYFNMKKFQLHWISDDLRSDFITWLYPKFANIIKNFNPSRSNFKTYIQMRIRLGYKTFFKERIGKEALQKAYEYEETNKLLDDGFIESKSTNSVACETVDKVLQKFMLSYEKKELSLKQKEILSRYILLLTCKSVHILTEEMIEKAILTSGLERTYFLAQLEKVRVQNQYKIDKINMYKEKINTYYTKLRSIEFELKKIDPYCLRYKELQKKHEYYLQRLAFARKKKKRSKTSPSNREISKTLEICRGTVDSTLASNLLEKYYGLS